MAPSAALATAPVTKRIHVAGLAPSVQPRELVQRFASFGTVLGGEHGVSGLGTTDTGLPRSFAFFSIETTEAQFARCMSMLNGSMWKAHKLRIGLAKPDWQQRRAEERQAAALAAEQPNARPKKRKRASDDVNVGFAAKNFELVTPENLSGHRGWVLDPKPVPAPLFPIIVRPSHPIEPPPQPAQTAWTRGKPKAKPSKAAREALRAGVPLEKPQLRRAKRMRIDPRRWGRQRVRFDLAAGSGKRGGGGGGGDAPAANMLRVGQWECEGPVVATTEEKDATATAPEAAVEWVFRTRDGQIRRRETVRLTQRSAPHTDNFTKILERMNRSAAPAAMPTGAGVTPSAVDPQEDAAPEEEGPARGGATAAEYRSPSPPPYIPAAPRNLIYNEEDAFHLMASALDDAERDAAHAMEHAAYRELARGALQEVGGGSVTEDQQEEEEEVVIAASSRVKEKVEGAPPLPKVEGFAADDEDEDDSDLFETLRLRGGGGVESSDDSSSGSSDSDSDSDSDSSSSADSDSADDESSNTVRQVTSEEDELAGAARPATADKPSLQATLTSLFKPSDAPPSTETANEGGFSLLAGMDLELDPDAVRTPSPEPVPLQFAAASAPHIGASVTTSTRFVPPSARDGGYRGGAALPRFSGPSRPFFPLPSGVFAAAPASVGAPGDGEEGGADQQLARATAESRARVEAAAKDFYRHETQDRIDEDHQQLREVLRGHARKRHREVVKRTKRTGAKRGVAVKLDLLHDD